MVGILYYNVIMEYFHLIYHSKAIPELTQVDLSEILATARRENLKNRITGFLTYRDHYFLQLLEGNENKVKETLDRIKKDTRHSSVTVIGEYKSTSQLMPDWNMAQVDSMKIAASAKDLINLFETARGKNVFDSKESLEFVLKKFSKDAAVFIE